ncbi:uncharacterized protein LOC143200063 [Rhynchophorus ferrugineus]|uniref:uncharacterized protein LOC143200063 n=1 Tax=Rhynchophorus ferrugineus TaxID=354439 RepID=UPI003FCD9CA9
MVAPLMAAWLWISDVNMNLVLYILLGHSVIVGTHRRGFAGNVSFAGRSFVNICCLSLAGGTAFADECSLPQIGILIVAVLPIGQSCSILFLVEVPEPCTYPWSHVPLIGGLTPILAHGGGHTGCCLSDFDIHAERHPSYCGLV